jgi:hypothetical protein
MKNILLLQPESALSRFGISVHSDAQGLSSGLEGPGRKVLAEPVV